MVGAVPLNAVPLESVPEMVPVPVTAKDNVAVSPLQITGVPLKAAVGLGSTVTVALPDQSEAIAVQLASFKVEIE